ncbi:hypothetical protein P3W45_000986 [Vairimorpha bombi]
MWSDQVDGQPGKKVELMVKDCSTTRLTKNDIIGSATAVLDDSERQQLPSVPNLERTFRNIQSKSHNLSYMNNYDVPNELLNTRSGLLFVQSDNYFVSKEPEKYKNVFSFDGTFYVFPKGFHQLFVGFYVENYKYIPYCYFLLTDKRQKSYETAFNMLKCEAWINRLDNVILNFEKVIERSITQIYPETTIRYCLFHIHKMIIEDIPFANNGAEGFNSSLNNEKNQYMLEDLRKILELIRNISEDSYMQSLKKICGIYNFNNKMNKNVIINDLQNLQGKDGDQCISSLEYYFRTSRIPEQHANLITADALSRSRVAQLNNIQNYGENIDEKIIECHKLGIKISQTQIKNIIKKCLTCKKKDRKYPKSRSFVETFSPRERGGFDILEIKKRDLVVLGIDYYTRKIFGKAIRTKKAEKVLDFINELCEDNEIELAYSIPYYNLSNGRIERANRATREAPKRTKDNTRLVLKSVKSNYNAAVHQGLVYKVKNKVEIDKRMLVSRTVSTSERARSMSYDCTKAYSEEELLSILKFESLTDQIRKARVDNDRYTDILGILQEEKLFCNENSGVEDSNRILVFGTDESFIHLSNSSTVLADGIFKYAPTGFLKLYTLMSYNSKNRISRKFRTIETVNLNIKLLLSLEFVPETQIADYYEELKAGRVSTIIEEENNTESEEGEKES